MSKKELARLRKAALISTTVPADVLEAIEAGHHDLAVKTRVTRKKLVATVKATDGPKAAKAVLKAERKRLAPVVVVEKTPVVATPVVKVRAPRPAPEVPTFTVSAESEAVKLGASVRRYLLIHARKPYQKDAEIVWMATSARAAWTAVLNETGAREAQ